MAEFVIMSDSCCDLSAEMADELGVRILPLTFQIQDRTYRNYLDGRELSFSEFYRQVRGGECPVTSAVSVGDYQRAMREALEEGKDLLCICFSSALSATYQSAVMAGEELRDEFPERTILVLDSLCASLGQGLLVWLCAQEQRRGRSLEEVWDYAEKTKGRICHWFTVDDLNHLKRGGRVSATAALFGTMLSIKPVLHVDNAGRLIPMEKCRGRRASLMALADHMAKTAEKPEEQTIFISHGDCLADAQLVADELKRRLGVRTVHLNYVGPVIGSHTGGGVVALFFLGRER